MAIWARISDCGGACAVILLMVALPGNFLWIFERPCNFRRLLGFCTMGTILYESLERVGTGET